MAFRPFNPMHTIWAGGFISSAAVVLLVTGAAKILSAISGGHVLETLDPIFGITLRKLFWFTGAIEVFVSFVCLFGQRLDLQVALLLWLGGNFVVYRVGLAWVGGPKFCSCLGTLTGAINISPASADSAMKFILAYMLVGSSATLFWLWKYGRADGRQKTVLEAVR